MTVLRTLGADPWFGGRLMVSRAGSVFDAEGLIVDEKAKQNLAKFIEGFAAFVADHKRADPACGAWAKDESKVYDCESG